LAGSAVKLANPRNDTYGSAVSRGPRKESCYRSGRSIVTAQSGGGSVRPTANQTPDSTQTGTDLLFNMSNTGHTVNNSFAFASENDWIIVDRTARWYNFQAPPAGTISKITLKLNWTHYSQIDNVLPAGAYRGVWRIFEEFFYFWSASRVPCYLSPLIWRATSLPASSAAIPIAPTVITSLHLG